MTFSEGCVGAGIDSIVSWLPARSRSSWRSLDVITQLWEAGNVVKAQVVGGVYAHIAYW